MSNFLKLNYIDVSDNKSKIYRKINGELSAIIQAIPDGIWVCDGNGKVLFLNKAAEKFHGVKADVIVDKNIVEVVQAGLIDQAATTQVLKTGRRVSVMQYVNRSDKYLLVTGVPIFDSKGKISLIVSHGRDMTQLNAIKKDLQEAKMVTEKIKAELNELGAMELKKEEIIAESKGIRHVLRLALKLANIEGSNILILGESGTGKGLLAKFIHQHSRRKNKPFIQINCAALPESLLEAELFGYNAGAFTGASDKGKAGLFELADKGTLFLDEIGDLPHTVQAKLLKYLDDKKILRLGSLSPKMIDCTIVAATNRNLEALKNQGKFRDDLFYRLNSFVLHIPPLREREEDLLEMIRYFQYKYQKKFEVKRTLSPKLIRGMQNYPFPGNVRELKNMIKKAVVLGDSEIEISGIQSKGRSTKSFSRIGTASLNEQMLSFEKEILTETMHKCRTTREMAYLLRVDQSTVVRKLKKFGLSRK